MGKSSILNAIVTRKSDCFIVIFFM